MSSKEVIFIADSLDNAYKFQKVLSALDVGVAAGSSVQVKTLLRDNPDCHLVVFEARGEAVQHMSTIETMLVDNANAALLVIVDEEQLEDLHLPVQIKNDFVVHGASESECAVRIRQLLWPGNEGGSSDYLVIDTMTINLATYQVKINGEPIDLTYLEYALLAFLVTHPNKTYSRDALLRRVWGFDYYGGSRTVDVHVRRIRAKLGPDLAQRLETIRGIGYLWSM